MTLRDAAETQFIVDQISNDDEFDGFWIGASQSTPPSDGIWKLMLEEIVDDAGKDRNDIFVHPMAAHWRSDELFDHSCAILDIRSKKWSSVDCVEGKFRPICERPSLLIPSGSSLYVPTKVSDIVMSEKTCFLLPGTRSSSCYRSSIYSAPWTLANETCHALEGHLVEVRGPKENAVLTYSSHLTNDVQYWIGGALVEGTWSWMRGLD